MVEGHRELLGPRLTVEDEAHDPTYADGARRISEVSARQPSATLLRGRPALLGVATRAVKAAAGPQALLGISELRGTHYI
jgi:hypothetical protein